MFKYFFRKRQEKALLEYKEELDTLGLHGEEQRTQIVNTRYNEDVLLYHSKIFNNHVKVRLITGVRKESAFIHLVFKGKQMEISDIKFSGKSISKGYGTILLEYALKVAGNRNVEEVIGNLFSTDEENKLRQINFYGKYGFKIVENQIRLIL